MKNNNQDKVHFSKSQIVISSISMLSNILFFFYIIYFFAFTETSFTKNGFYLWGGGFAIYLIISVLSFFPTFWNIPSTESQSKRKQIVKTTRTLICSSAFLVTVMFIYMSYHIMNNISFSTWFFIGTVIALLIVLYMFFSKVK